MPHLPLRWLYLDLNSYFASVEQQIEPHLRGKPVAVVPMMTDSTCAIAASYEAKAFGVKTGTPIWEAKKLCKDLICVPARHEAYVDYHHRILNEVENHLHITAVASIDEVACRLIDNENSSQTALKIANNIKKGIARNVGEHLKSSIGIAPNKYLAKVATEMQKPDGLVILNEEDIQRRLFELNLRDLPGIGRSMERRLHNMGIDDIKTLWNYSPKHLRKIWHSIWGEKMWYMLRGIEIPDIETHRSTVGHSHVLAPENRAPEKAQQIAARLTTKAAARLRRLDFYAENFSFSARLENGQRWAGEAKCFRAQDNETFLAMLDGLWSMMTKDTKNGRLKKVSVTLHKLMPANQIQPELFDMLDGGDGDGKEKQTKANNLSSAMDAINKKFGRDAVSLGILPSNAKAASGSKIAFTRIPDIMEFVE